MTKWTPHSSTHLTLSERGYQVLVGGKLIGAVIRSSSGAYVGWSKSIRLGDYTTMHEAETAVRGAKKKTRARR